ncbi:MAG: BCCT family transporter [Bacteroidetes bacterium]|nr:BCCT family transporter [Bacteroidota bacterium]
MTRRKFDSNIDWFVFITTAVVIVAVAISLMVAPDRGAAAVDSTFRLITNQFGMVYVWASIATIGFLLWLALGRYGTVKLGPPEASPVFSTASWGAMLFSAGIGTAVLHWGTIEWVYYYLSPPFGVAPQSQAALEWAGSYGLFHWGFTGWAFYGLPAVALAYAYHVRGIPSLRLSSACHAILGERADGALGRVIDILFMVGLLGAAGTGIGFTTPLITGSFSHFFATPETFTMTVGAVFLVVVIFSFSVYAGLDKGIKRLSTINVTLTLLLLVFILLVGPTVFILKMGTNSIGHMLQNYLKMNTWTDPLTDSRFVEDWTIFYWAWWIALGPFVGMFISKISRRRTLRQVVFGVLGFGTLGCTLCFVILGNYALYLELEQVLPVVEILTTEDAATAVIQVVTSLPPGRWILPLFFFICVVFAATTYDSASYTLAAAATRTLSPDEDPARWHRVFWAFGLGVVPIALLFLGGLKSLQTASVVVSLPLLVISLLMAWSLVRALRQDQA